MLDLENQIVDYFNSDKFKNTTPYLSYKNISKNLKIQPKRVRKIMYKSNKFETVEPSLVGSGIHKDNINIYKLK